MVNLMAQLAGGLPSVVTVRGGGLSNDYSLQRVSCCSSEWDIYKVKMGGDGRVSSTP